MAEFESLRNMHPYQVLNISPSMPFEEIRREKKRLQALLDPLVLLTDSSLTGVNAIQAQADADDVAAAQLKVDTAQLKVDAAMQGEAEGVAGQEPAATAEEDLAKADVELEKAKDMKATNAARAKAEQGGPQSAVCAAHMLVHAAFEVIRDAHSGKESANTSAVLAQMKNLN